MSSEIFRRVIALKTNENGQVEIFDGTTGERVDGVSYVIVNIPSDNIATASVEYVNARVEEYSANIDIQAYETSYRDLSDRASVSLHQVDGKENLPDDFSSKSPVAVQIEANGYVCKLTPKEALDLCSWIIQHTQALGMLAMQAGDIPQPAQPEQQVPAAATTDHKPSRRRKNQHDRATL